MWWVVKFLGEYNRFCSYLFVLDFFSVKDKRILCFKIIMFFGVDFIWRFVDSIYGFCLLVINWGLVDIRSFCGLLILDCIYEGCLLLFGCEKKGLGIGIKMWLWGVDDIFFVKKVIVFFMFYGKDSFRKYEKLVKWKDLNECFIYEVKKDFIIILVIGILFLFIKLFIDCYVMVDIFYIFKDFNFI